MKSIILILILFLIQSSLQLDERPIEILSFENSIVYKYNELITYVSSWHFETTNYNLDFICTLDTNKIRNCLANISEEDTKKMYGDFTVCKHDPINNIKDCQEQTISVNTYPTPIVKPEFRPSTKGGKETIHGYYLYIGSPHDYRILQENKKAKITSDYDLSSFNPNSIDVNYPDGCGAQTIKWINYKLYNFSYQNPIITNTKVNGSFITIEGSNFSNMSRNVTITIDNIPITSSNILSVEHDLIRINYEQVYPSNLFIKVDVCGLSSNSFLTVFNPLPNSINSVPKNKGGLIVINGARLFSSNESTLVKIGNNSCSNVVVKSNQIKCNIDKITNSNDQTKDLKVSISIGNMTNDNYLKFTFDIPFISEEYTLPDGVLNLKGDCLGSSSTTKVYLNGSIATVQDLTINEYETSMSFLFRNQRSNVSILVNEVKSNQIWVDGNFYATISEVHPSVNGQSVNFTLYNINSINYNLIPTITFKSDNTKRSGVKVQSNSDELSNQIFTFQIPEGCGEQQIEIRIGNQICPSVFYYRTPSIDCSTESQRVVCLSNLTDYIHFYNSKNIKFVLSNEYIEESESQITFNSTMFSFLIKDNYSSGKLSIEVCNSRSNSTNLDISPKFNTYENNNKFKIEGGIILIIGQNFNNNINNSMITCNSGNSTNNTTHTCNLLDYGRISCKLNLKGPYDRLCKYSYNRTDHFEITISYIPPVVSNVSNRVIASQGGILTINGEEFYDLNNTIISVGERYCDNIQFINSTTLTCKLNSSLVAQQSNNQYVKVTINDKSGGSNLLVYSNEEVPDTEDSINEIGDGDNGGHRKPYRFKVHPKWRMIVGIVIPGFLVVSLLTYIFIIYIKERIRNLKRSAKNKKGHARHKKDLEVFERIKRIKKIRSDNAPKPPVIPGALEPVTDF